MMELDPKIVQMQTAFLEAHRKDRRWIIVETGGGFEVHTHTIDGVAPPSTYNTKRQAAARVLQLLGTGPVAPQTWPEEVCIGNVQIEQDKPA